MTVGLKEFIEITGFVILVFGFFMNMTKTNQIKSNCIATLNARVDELERKITALFRRTDESRTKDEQISIQLARIEQKVSDKLNGGSR